MSVENTYYVTTPIYYVNDAPHIGHAYTTLACDVLARFKRLDGFDVRFLTGTDEHGQKVEKAAETAGVDPQQFTDEVSANFRKLAEAMNFSFDDFIRTTEERHKISTQALWQRLLDAGDIYLDTYKGWYAVRDEAFYAEAEIVDGPDGTKVGPTGAEVEWVEEPSYFFRLSAWQDRLLDFYESNPDFILPISRRNEVVSFVKGGLKDLSVSRTTFNWGIPVPGDDKHIMYVWLDALNNYLTSTGFPDTEGEIYESYWPANLHMVGKDIVRFHAVYWPAFLLAAGLAVPERIFAHGWWTNEGQKISKSIGNVIDPFELVERYGLDPVRYFLMREVPFGNDGDFSHQAMVMRLNSDLANDIGNLCQRILTMIFKNCAAQVPAKGAFTSEDHTLLEAAADMLEAARTHLDKQSFHNALIDIWKVVGDANRYVDTMAPWTLRKEDPDRMATVLYVLAETIRRLGVIVQPFIPDAAASILDLMAVDEDKRSFAYFDEVLESGVALPKPEPIFPRFVEGEIA
ncbi:methionine--tRNA ligase [Alphaproteobacteria bacterium]|nr:methionine--tRNA ligase [Alphaproteobacteria bacterium]